MPDCTMFNLSRLSIALVTLVAALPAQDPPAPPGGFPTRNTFDLLVTYSDGYKTRLDIRHPTVTPPRSGWPCAMVLHGGGSNRKAGFVKTIANLLARSGYVVLCYDTGGNGDTVKLNTVSRRTNELRIRDIAEMFLLAERRLGTLMDHTRLAVEGRSGGAQHALWAASYSTRVMPVTSTVVARMPKISAVFTDIQVIDFLSDSIPGGNMLRSKWAVDQIGALGQTSTVATKMMAGDYQWLTGYVNSQPGWAYFNLLKGSDVPVFVCYAYDDLKHFVNVNGNAIGQLKRGVPRRYFQGTNGHNSADNANVELVRNEQIRRWFDRFLKGIKNGVDTEPLAEVAMLPSDPTTYQNPKSLWQHRHSKTWPVAPARRLYLRGGHRLHDTAPASTETGGIVRHRVANGYGWSQYVADKGGAAKVLAKIPLSGLRFDSPVFTTSQELLGRTIVEVEVTTKVLSGFQLAAAVLDVDSSGQARFVTNGVTALRQVAAGRHRVRVELGDVGYVFPKGHKLRLSLENLSLRRQPGNPNFYTVPEFHDYDLRLEIDTTFAPRVALPLSAAGPSLVPRRAVASAVAGVDHRMKMVGQAHRAGRPYLLLLGASGAWPGFSAPPPVPLNLDVFTNIGITLINTPVCPRFAGVLDANGEARPRFVLPSPIASVVLGKTFTFVGASSHGSSYHVTNPVELVLDP